ncbi:MAG: type IV-A pilus assembly ATPase PilB [Gammaproteobacteria bacterium]
MATQTAANTTSRTPPGSLIQALVAQGLLADARARQLDQEARAANTPLIPYLVEHASLPARELALAASICFGRPLMDLNAIVVDPECVRKIDERLIQAHRVLPFFERGSTLYIAVSDLGQARALDEIRFKTGRAIEPILVEHDKLQRAIGDMLDNINGIMPGVTSDEANLLNEVDLDSSAEASSPSIEMGASQDDEQPIIRFVKNTILQAIQKEASDIHFEPYEKFYRVRMRIDGILRDYSHPPVQFKERIAARIKVLARLNIAEHRLPQDGKIRVNLGKQRAIDFRVSSIPAVYGEKIVLRLLDASMSQMGIESLGFEPAQKEIYLHALNQSHGMILVTGPTGSGKTVTMYAGINHLNTNERNISTAEDPVEIQLPGVNQVNVYPAIGLGFADALRAFLRQDPDVILVGEIRDLPTAEIAVKAAQTGHLVLSTLHTNDAPQTLTRLLDIGVPAYSVASSIHLIISQRLARKLCEHCKQRANMTPQALDEAGFPPALTAQSPKIFHANPDGCPQCQQGYRGRIGIYQVFPISDAMSELMMNRANAIQIAAQAHTEGIWDLRRAGLEKVAHGVTSLEEIDRVISS